MGPFDSPPSTPPVSFEPPDDQPEPRRGRTMLAIAAAVVLVGGGAFGVSSFVAADDEPELAVPDDGDDGDENDDGDEPADDQDDGDDESDRDDESDGDGDQPAEPGEGDDPAGDDERARHRRGPFVFDFDDLERLDDLDEESLQQFQECVGLPAFDFRVDGELPEIDPQRRDELESLMEEFLGDFESMFGDAPFGGELDDLLDGELDELFGEIPERPAADRAGVERRGPHRAGPGAIFGDDDLVIITGSDGVTVIDLGDGDGSVTITRDGDTGEVSVTTEGTASEEDLSAVFDFELPEDLGDIEIPEFDHDLPGRPFGDFDPGKIEDCLDDLG